MAEDRVDVRFGAQTGELRAGVSEAIGILNESFGSLTSLLSTVTTGFLGLAIGEEVISKIGEAFERVVGQTQEFDEKIDLLSKKLGTSTEEATVLSTALANVGINTETYTGILFKLERQVATNEDKLKALGIATRDHNDRLLEGNALMQSALARMQEFRAGTDQNAFALTAFGRSAEQVYQILRLTPEVLATASSEVEQFGAVTEANVEAAHHYQEAVNKLGTEWGLFVTGIGNAVIPALTSLLTWLDTDTEALRRMQSQAEQGITGVSIAALQAEAATLDKLLKAGADPGSRFGTKDVDARFAAEKRLLEIDQQLRDLEVAPAATGGKESFVDHSGDAAAAKKAAEEEKKWLDTLIADRKKATAARLDTEKASIDIARTTAEGELDIEQEKINQEAVLGQISAAESIRQTEALEQRRYEIELKALQDRVELMGLENKERERLDVEIEKLEQKHQLTMTQLQNRATQAQIASWKTILSPIQQTISQSVQGILQGTQTVMGAVRNLLTGLLSSFVDFGAKWASEWLIQQMVTETTASATSVTSSIGQIMNSAAVAAAGAYAAIAAIPYVGPALAPAAAATAYGATASFAAGVIPFAEQGFDVPRDTLAYLHKDEMVLPKELGDVVRQGGGGDIHLHVHATDGDSVKRLFKNHGASLAAALRHQMRNFNPSLKPT